MTFQKPRLTVLMLLALTTFQLGCEERSLDEVPSPIVQEEHGFVLVFVLDLSGSFADKMFADDAKAYRFFLRSSDDFFRNRLGEPDQLILARGQGANGYRRDLQLVGGDRGQAEAIAIAIGAELAVELAKVAERVGGGLERRNSARDVVKVAG